MVKKEINARFPFESEGKNKKKIENEVIYTKYDEKVKE